MKNTKPIKLFNGAVIPEGTEMRVTVQRDKPAQGMIWLGDQVAPIRSSRLWQYFDEFEEITEDKITIAMNHGACLSLTGANVEPDGWDSFGFPSMLMALGVV